MTELEKAHRLLSQMIGWQRDAEIEKAKLSAENERLKAEIAEMKRLEAEWEVAYFPTGFEVKIKR
jgi:hypothetical protein